MTSPGTAGDAGAALPAVTIDILVEAGAWPAEADLESAANEAVVAALAEAGARGAVPSELSLVFTDDASIQTLNAQWRGKDKATNVLSFPAFPLGPGDALPPMLGDIVLAAETVSREADIENKPFDHHLRHLIVHGLLHLLGYDHEEEADAVVMEDLERRALARLAIPDPYT